MEPLRPHHGFTLIELLVVLAIITIISAIVLTSQSTFNKTIVLANTAYDIALTIRSAESYGLGSRVLSLGAVNTGYGINFQKAMQTSFTLFADSYPAPSITSCHPTTDASAPDAKPGNCIYDITPTDEKVTTYTLGNGIIITNFCAYNGSWSCASGGPLTSLDIVFMRSSSEPFIRANGAPTVYTAACLRISSRQGGAPRYISVGASGIITANATSCP